MNDYHYVPDSSLGRRTYAFHVELAPNTNGHWQARIALLPGCTAWGYTRDEALKMMHTKAEHYVKALLAKGMNVPSDREAADTPTVSVTV